MSTYLTRLINDARAAIADLRTAIAEGFPPDEIETFGDIADDLIDLISTHDLAAASRLSASVATLAA